MSLSMMHAKDGNGSCDRDALCADGCIRVTFLFRVGCIIGALVAIIFIWHQYLFFGHVDCDSDFMIWVSRRMALGDALYADVIDQRFPIVYQFLTIVWWLFGSYSACVVSILCIDTVSMIVGMGILLRGRGLVSGALRVAMVSLLVSRCIPGQVELGAFCVLVLCGDVSRRMLHGEVISRKTWLLGGFLMGLLSLAKPTVCVMCALVMVPAIAVSGYGWRGFCTAFLLAFGVFFVDMAFVVCTSGLDAVVYVLLGQNGGYFMSSLQCWASYRDFFIGICVVAVLISFFLLVRSTWLCAGRVSVLWVLPYVLVLGMCLLRPWGSYFIMCVCMLAASDSGDVPMPLSALAFSAFATLAVLALVSSRGGVGLDGVMDVVKGSGSVSPGYFSYSVSLMHELGLESSYRLPFLCSVGDDLWMEGPVSDVADGRYEYVVVRSDEKFFMEPVLSRYEMVFSDVNYEVFHLVSPSSDGLIFNEKYREPVGLF